ncbi:hypothetical protein LTR93_011325 [Exophiala xenobiotica]|nr:hypothetical protein LTR93_011325 [Exophiala xenobiotica]
MIGKAAHQYDDEVPSEVAWHFIGLNSKTASRAPSGSHPCQGIYWTPRSEKPKIAFMAVHHTVDYSEHYLAIPLALRGYGFLGWNTRYRNREDLFVLDNALEDISFGTKWLKEVAGVNKIIFIGNSGGGSLMAAFQAKATKVPSTLGADLFIFLNAHPGRPNVLTNWLDPSLVDETDVLSRDPSLDMYNPANSVPYSQEFIKRYRAAQIDRNHRITNWVKGELERLNDAGVPDRVFTIHRTMADLRFRDITIDPSDRPANVCYDGIPEEANRSIGRLGRSSSLRTWLSMWSLQESKSKFEDSAADLQVPTLVIQSTADAGVYPSDALEIFDQISATDKEIRMIPGGHYFQSEAELRGAVEAILTWMESRI